MFKETCKVCHEDVSPESVHITPCRHIFHGECFSSVGSVYMDRKAQFVSCPFCHDPCERLTKTEEGVIIPKRFVEYIKKSNIIKNRMEKKLDGLKYLIQLYLDRHQFGATDLMKVSEALDLINIDGN